MKIPWLSSNDSSSSSINSNIRIIGDRFSGKTVYLASLAYLTQCPNYNIDSPIKSITSSGDEQTSKQLLKYAQDILEKGLQLQPTKINKNSADEVNNYGLKITLSEGTQLVINCKEYAGEFFEDLIYNMGDPYLDDYIEDCNPAKGFLLLVDGTSHRKDNDYAQGLANFFKGLDHLDNSSQERRIAFTLNKCELPQLWVDRHEPREMAKRLFPKTMRQLQIWADKEGRELDYFATSAFGILGKDYPQPNTTIVQTNKDGSACIIRKPKLWRPFGLVAPIYWLCSGQRHKTLDED